jgi:hypothetical protein
LKENCHGYLRCLEGNYVEEIVSFLDLKFAVIRGLILLKIFCVFFAEISENAKF